jgi:hypothetical protein
VLQQTSAAASQAAAATVAAVNQKAATQDLVDAFADAHTTDQLIQIRQFYLQMNYDPIQTTAALYGCSSLCCV